MAGPWCSDSGTGFNQNGWFDDGAAGWVGLDDTPRRPRPLPRPGPLCHRYGLRALRLGVLESGHLAQTLLLTATASGLASTPIAGFDDDLAHELLALDDMDQPLQYCCPWGAPGTAEARAPARKPGRGPFQRRWVEQE
ncbi:hypothetical protein C7C46_31765 [Streptomyces tateyamensis]|uniref:Nitroreductase domain-containing protein n=1 Tax=Streptomyces tateyamensis TaxID=565073 RepID=A0A2V4N003_9ACTN|nr:nitroreductase family protein [Streptomyces tateyamensis]PYC66071.1 hypothetical protein C7C46_31765 [Streptomyces tateyamensis]